MGPRCECTKKRIDYRTMIVERRCTYCETLSSNGIFGLAPESYCKTQTYHKPLLPFALVLGKGRLHTGFETSASSKLIWLLSANRI